MGKLPFFRLEFRGMDAAPDAAHFNGVLEVQHLVKEQVFDGVTGAGGAVEDAADDDGVVGGVVMAERALGHVLAPGELGAAKETAEEAEVEGIEYLFEVIVAAFGPDIALAAAGAADEFGLAGDGGAGREPLVAMVLRRIDWLLVKLGQQDVGNGTDDRFGGAFEQVREADEDLAFAKADGGVQRGEPAETDHEWRHRGPRPQSPILVLKDRDELRGHKNGG